LAQRGDSPVIGESDDMYEFRVQSAARYTALTSVVTGDEQSAVVEQAELFRPRLCLVVASDHPPQLALHCIGSVVASAHVERKAVSGMPDELWMQQARQCLAVTCGEGSVKQLSARHFRVQVGGYVHLAVPFSGFRLDGISFF
jgi:hypothetical protein